MWTSKVNLYLPTHKQLNYNKINELLTIRGMSKPQLAEKIGMSKAGIYLAIDKKRLSVDILEKIAEALEVPVNVFFGEEDSTGLITELENTKEELSIHKAGLLHLGKRNDQQRALLAMIRSRLKSSTFLYKMIEANHPGLDPKSIEAESIKDLKEILIETYGEIIDAINLSQDITLNYIEAKKYTNPEITDFWKTTLGIESDEKLTEAYNRFITRKKENV